MVELLDDEFRIARKDYICNASADYVFAAYSLEDLRDILPQEEFRVAFRMYMRNCKIKKGERYIYQRTVDSGEFSTFRGNLEMVSVASYLELFED